MAHGKKDTAFGSNDNLKILYTGIKSMIAHIPVLATAINGWELASHGFAGERKSYRTWQQWRSFFAALLIPQFASKWFDILNLPYFSLVAVYRKRLYFKPFRVYMSTRWTIKQKIKVILDTYRFILSKGEAFKQVITSNKGIEIARFKLNDIVEGILTLGYDERYRKEGELVFSFRCGHPDRVISSAAFSFEEIEEGKWVCRIACIQGHSLNNENLSKTAQKLMHGLRPKSFLVFAIQEFSRQLGFTAIYGASDAIQAYRRKHFIHLPWIHKIRFDYNAFWSESGGRPGRGGWYELPLMPVRKSMQEIKSHKRSLYLKRYDLLDDLSLKIGNSAKRLSHEGFSVFTLREPAYENNYEPATSHA